MTRLEASQVISTHLLAMSAWPDEVSAIRQVWEIAFKTGGVTVICPFVELRPVIEAHLKVCDLAATAEYGAARCREAAATLRWLLDQAERVA